MKATKFNFFRITTNTGRINHVFKRNGYYFVAFKDNNKWYICSYDHNTEIMYYNTEIIDYFINYITKEVHSKKESALEEFLRIMLDKDDDFYHRKKFISIHDFNCNSSSKKDKEFINLIKDFSNEQLTILFNYIENVKSLSYEKGRTAEYYIA